MVSTGIETTESMCPQFYATKRFTVTGIGPDLMEAAKDAVKAMIDLLGRDHGLAPADAYMPYSVCADLRFSEIVDQPNWAVSSYFPRVVFE